ncbi:hypothetical protein ABVT39_010507 [Epinephelus coioides]
MFDESLNHATKKKQLDVHVRYWVGDQVHSRYLGSQFMGHATAQDLMHHFKDGGQTEEVQEQVTSTKGQNNFYSNYTNLYAPIVTDSESEPEEHMEHTAEESKEDLTAADIVSEFSTKITKTCYSRFNINRVNVWDGAIRGFKGSSFDPSHEILVKFTDDEGQAEDGLDTGGPKREFLTLLMNRLRT